MATRGSADGLRNAAQQKSQDALERTNKAISMLVKKGQTINFHTVAKAAGVSVAYFYKDDSIKQRIAQLRNQQSPIKQLSPKTTASDDSRKAIITTLKERLKKLEAENRGLRQQIELSYGRTLYADEQAEKFKQEAEAIRTENAALKKQLENEFQEFKQARGQAKTKVKAMPNSSKKVTYSSISNKIQAELDALGIKMSSTLAKIITTTAEAEVLFAIDALKAALLHGNIRNPSGFLVEAIRNTWTPNQEYEKQLEMVAFNEWYPIAQSLGLVVAATQLDGMQYVLTQKQEWIPFEQMLLDYPLKKLQEMT
ncbi:MAG: hypothetical protein KME31_27905 [Tolypothrix carrinoi HA7290-LM1]|jgi:chromosome segregation ATPase|nr:hypothetical protein [Tolypothrix carrinoi HA7290-LM1]